MSRQLERVVVVGASVAGVTAVETLRRHGFDGSIHLIGDEGHLPYDRPPLSKQVLSGAWDAERVTLRDEAALGLLQADVRLACRATSIDVTDSCVQLDDGNKVPYDGLIIATGVTPRRLSVGHELAGVHVLRTIDDAVALRDELHSGRRLVIVGGGFMGCEVAAVAKRRGLEVCIVDALPVPLFRQFGREIGRRIALLHEEHGVTLQCGVGVRRLIGDTAVTGVQLATGTVLPADLVLVAIGSVPATDWLRGSGLKIDDGVLCDATCRAAPGVYAAGDVARWWHEITGSYVRVEHRLNATEQAINAAANLLGAEETFKPIPYFWTDQYDARIQAYGFFDADCQVTVTQGDFAEGRFLAHFTRSGVVTGVLGWNMPRETRAERDLVWQMSPALSKDGNSAPVP
ncbi:NAD(P)/FAD-dependent oxidoreductase [Rhodococcus sp. NPDC059968]|uniref:NAD(P)/FAD-dependent oxidoreductase n=1 Tax=Rhodococcus sp. NPDC059968 TaxID=3347017 RepID=UPI003672E868